MSKIVHSMKLTTSAIKKLKQSIEIKSTEAEKLRESWDESMPSVEVAAAAAAADIAAVADESDR